MNVTQKITILEQKVAANLAAQVWPKNTGALEYFNQTKQGTRFDDALYDEISNYLSSDVSTVLDIGAGEGKLAQNLLQKNYHVTCIEPSITRFNILRDKKINSLHCTFDEINQSKVFDCLILLRSIGIASKIGDRFSLHKTLQKIVSMSKSQVIIISKAIEDKAFVSKEFQNFKLFNKKPWVFHYDMLKLMTYSPTLKNISIEVDKPYLSMEDCIRKDFLGEDVDNVKDYLSKFSHYKDNLFYRRVRLLFPIVSLLR